MLTIGKVAQVALAFALPTSIILVYWWYKNRSDEDTYRHKRVLTSRNTVVEVKVPQQAIGPVIGRQGSNIKLIQKETGTVIHFQNTDRGENGNGDNSCKTHRTLVIRGTPESVHQAELMVYQIIADVSNILTEDVEVPTIAIGRIIGKGGATIREISSISGARIIIDRNDSYNELDRPRIISIKGSEQQIKTALKLIQIKLEEHEQFQSKLSETTGNGKRNNTSSETNQHIKITASKVPRSNESWDVEPNKPNQEKHLNNAGIEVYVSAVEHPGHFWVQMIGANALQLEQLQNEITAFACSDDAKLNYTVTEVNIGEMVAAQFETGDVTYYRAKILGTTEDGKVDLYFVDFGDSSYAEKKDIFRLRSDFTSFPYQAKECILANVEPVGEKWSEEAITYFEDIIHCAKWKSLLAHVVTYKRIIGDQKMPVVQLFDTSGPQNIDIGAEMVKCGYALSIDSVTQNTQGSAANVQESEITTTGYHNVWSETESSQVTVIEEL